jgi:ATP-dependent RNA helicase DBP3
MQEKAVKTAKKTLKKNESMKLSQLAKTVVTQLGNDDGSIVVTKEQVKGWITDSSKFTIKGKHVSLSTKRSSSSVSELPSKNEIAVAAANSKKQKTTEPTDAATWRTNHKIVLLSLSATDDSNVALNNDANLEPFQTFAAASGKLNAALIEQCERGNGFTTPSPIQAQAWPILCADKDMVGIAETGSGKVRIKSVACMVRSILTLTCTFL